MAESDADRALAAAWSAYSDLPGTLAKIQAFAHLFGWIEAAVHDRGVLTVEEFITGMNASVAHAVMLSAVHTRYREN